jgi:hypothetical protein
MKPEDAHFGSAKSSVIAGDLSLIEAIQGACSEDLARIAAASTLTGDLALALMKRPDLPAEALEQIAKNRSAQTRKVKFALACHPGTPRHVSVPLVRQLYTFDLMKLALSTRAPADVKLTADETLIARLKTVTLGERLTLARQASGRIAAALLLDGEKRIMSAALENSRLTETLIVKTVLKPAADTALVQAVSRHTKWSLRSDVQVALLQTPHLSLARALTFACAIPPAKLRDILKTSRLPEKIKNHLVRENEKASGGQK